MNMHTLDELAVPQPPYRMKRPEAMLAAAEEPVIASTEGEALPPLPEALPPSPEAGTRSPAEVAAEQSAAIESATQDARAKLDRPPLADATREESGQDDADRQSALGQVESAATDANARATALKESLVRMASETRTPEQQNEDQAVAQRLRAERDQRRIDEAASAEERRQQEEQARKADIEYKKSVTRGQTAAIKEDAVREEKKLEEGIEFKQPEESAAQKAGRIGKEALARLNDFKDLQEKGASPEQLEFARQQANLAQKRAEAAKRGENIPDERVDMAKVKEAGAPPKPEGNPDQERWTAEWTQEISDAKSFDELYANMRDAGEYLVSPSTGKPVDVEQEIAVIENFRKTGNPVMAVEGGSRQTTRGLGVRGKVMQLVAEEQKPAVPSVEDQNVGVVKPDTELGAAVAEARQAAEAKSPEVAPAKQETPENMLSSEALAEFSKEDLITMAGIAEQQGRDQAYINQLLAEAEKRGQQPAEEEILIEAEPMVGTIVPEKGKVVGYEPSGKAIYEAIEERPTTDKVVEVRPDTAAGEAVAEARRAAEKVIAEAAPATPAESEPTAQEKLIAQLQERIAQLEAKSASPEVKADRAEGAPKPGGAEEALRQLIDAETLKGEKKSSFRLRLEAGKHEMKRLWYSTWAKRCSDLVGRRSTQLKKWEDASKKFADKSYAHTALSPILYDPFIWGLRKSTEHFSKWLEINEDKRKFHEDSRAELINIVAARGEAGLKASEQRAATFEGEAKGFDGALDAIYDDHKRTSDEYASATDPFVQAEKAQRLEVINRKLLAAMRLRTRAQRGFLRENKKAAGQQEAENLDLMGIDIPNQPDTSSGVRRKERVRKRPKPATKPKPAEKKKAA